MKKRVMMLIGALFALFSSFAIPNNAPLQPGKLFKHVDVCIYGATPSGINAAIAAKREGLNVLLVETTRYPGGILSAGLKPIQDCPNFKAVGGLTRKLILTLGMGRDDAINTSEADVRNITKTTMSPKTIRDDFVNLLKKYQIETVYEHRVSLVKKAGGKITEAFFDLAPPDSTGCPIPESAVKNNLKVSAKVFIDASYEGDLMAAAGLSYRTGREAVSEFNESHAGVRKPIHVTPIDPYVIPGDSRSGLLPWIDEDHKKPIGSADEYTQAYNFRFYVTDEPAYRYDIAPPSDYDPKQYELIGRYVTYLVDNKAKDSLDVFLSYLFPGWRNANDYNYQRRSLFTIAPLGISYQYADGDYREKARIWKLHQNYLSGLHYFLSTDPRVPESFRKKTAQLGFDKRHFPEGWPFQLYVRATRRMEGELILTQDDVYNKKKVADPIGLAQYGIDTYPARRFALEEDGKTYVAVEGNMFVGGEKGPTKVPYQIPYRCIVPQRKQCTNLLVPVCFSATHVAYASARMEPVFMVLGESAGIAAARAIKENCSVQDIDINQYQKKLAEYGQKINWNF